jgi:hypothetical protein
VNRKEWIIAGIINTILLVVGVMFVLNNRPKDPVETSQDVPVSILAYCTEQQVKPCVVSFSLDANDNMLVNILLPDQSFPDFYLTIRRSANESESMYPCQRVKEAVNNAYCTGDIMPPGEMLHLKLISIKDSILLAEGDLSILGLVYPTVGIAVATTVPPATEDFSTETPISTEPFPTEPTEPPVIILPTFPETPPSYPNPPSPYP